MKQPEPEHQQESLYLELPSPDSSSSSSSASTLPLHTSISLFLLSYCQCRSFRVLLVSPEPPVGGGDGGGDPSPSSAPPRSWSSQVPDFLGAREARARELPALVRSCRLPAVLDQTGRYCRAGLAVVLRHVVARTVEADPGRRDTAALLGFKNTCLKACAEVSQWTRLCELGVPAAVEALLLRPDDQSLRLPAAILRLESRLAEPVKVHNDDKIRRQKLQQQQKKKEEETGSDPKEEVSDPQAPPPDPSHGGGGLELRTALAKLAVDGGALPPPATRERPEIRKVKTAELPALEHVFAEGLYFTLTDVVLLPCVHRYLSSLSIHGSSSLLSQLPLLLRWYVRVQEVPGVPRAARACGLDLSAPRPPRPAPPPQQKNPPWAARRSRKAQGRARRRLSSEAPGPR